MIYMANEESNVKIGLGERFRAFVRGHTPTVARGVDTYLSLNLGDLIDRHNLAIRTDLKDVDEAMTSYSETIGGLEDWRDDTKDRLDTVKHRVELLEKKHGI